MTAPQGLLLLLPLLLLPLLMLPRLLLRGPAASRLPRSLSYGWSCGPACRCGRSMAAHPAAASAPSAATPPAAPLAAPPAGVAAASAAGPGSPCRGGGAAGAHVASPGAAAWEARLVASCDAREAADCGPQPRGGYQRTVRRGAPYSLPPPLGTMPGRHALPPVQRDCTGTAPGAKGHRRKTHFSRYRHTKAGVYSGGPSTRLLRRGTGGRRPPQHSQQQRSPTDGNGTALRRRT